MNRLTRSALVCVVALSTFIAHPSEALAERTWRATVGVDAGARRERLEVNFPGASYQEDRNLATSRLTLGVRWPWWSSRGFTLSGQSQIGVGWVYETGHPNVSLQQAALLERPLGLGFSIPFGLAVAGVFDTSNHAGNAVEISIPVGVRFRAVEALWAPTLALPIGEARDAVFTGEKTRSTAPGLVLLAFSARVLF